MSRSGTVRFACTMLGLAGLAQGADYYVSPTGSDGAPGTLATFPLKIPHASPLFSKGRCASGCESNVSLVERPHRPG
jgi:hypothetical protein